MYEVHMLDLSTRATSCPPLPCHPAIADQELGLGYLWQKQDMAECTTVLNSSDWQAGRHIERRAGGSKKKRDLAKDIIKVGTVYSKLSA